MKSPLTTFIKALLFPVLFILSIGYTYAQLAGIAEIKSLLDKADAYQKVYSSEKLYLHFDKPYYAVGDTIWFKAYLLNAGTRKASAYSNKVYVELLNDSIKVLQTLVVPVAAGLAQGDFTLNENFREGTYTIRAYTNWMQNFGEQSFFHQRFYIGKPGVNSWLVSVHHQSTVTEAGRQIKLGMQLKNAKGQPLVNQPVTLHVLESKKGFLKSDLLTGIDGTLNTDFVLPAKTDTRRLSLLLEDKQGKNKRLVIPFYPATDNDTDLQFMPEGGSLIAGLYNRIGFKAIGDDGLGVDVEGWIVNSKNEKLTAFKSLHNGMGNFAIVPNTGDILTAKIKLADGKEKNYNLPVVKNSGIVLRVDVVTNPDTVRLYITASPDKVTAGKSYYLLAQGKDVNYFGTGFSLSSGFFNIKIPKNNFLTGIISFIVLDQDKKPVNVRNAFIERHDNLNVLIKPGKPVYAAKDSIALDFKVADQKNNPVQANFSVTVTDDSQIKSSLKDQHINSYFLLASELKGHVEDADWYFNPAQHLAAKALDNLMLTQGWTGFSTEKALVKIIPRPTFLAEADNSIEGKLSNFFNKPAANRRVTLMSHWHGMFVMDTVSNSEGRFAFRNLPLSDSIAYTIKVHNANGKEAAVGIAVDEFKRAAQPAPDSTRLMPWYASADTTLLNYLKTNKKRLDQAFGPVSAKGRLLKEVKIKGQKKARLQGERGEDIYFADEDIDEKAMSKGGNVTLLQYMYKNVRGFHTAPIPGMKTRISQLGDYLFVKAAVVANVIVDSTSVFRYYDPLGNVRRPEFMLKMLDNIPAASVKNLVIYHKPTLDGTEWYSLIFVKTRSGNGPVLKETPGIYVYRPLPLYLPRQFYRPKYNVNDQDTLPDLRSTIHWEPNLVTDEKGNAKLSFYAADKPSTYTVTVEGTDMQGHFGVSTGKIIVLQGTAK